ncbi:MAG: hypothetical protein AAGG51_18190 [Cyanobacteria bacterium P01_G01_bin.54]
MELFYKEFPPSRPVGFIIMRFGSTPEHSTVLAALEDVSRETGVSLIRADHRLYHDDLFENVRIYLHGCSFGIAVFEDAEARGFNPNVSLEVGYLHALRKPVLHLKSSSLSKMPTDLLSKLYCPYDSGNINADTKAFISDWIIRRVNVKKTDDSLPTSIQSISQLLSELFPSIPVQDGEEHLARHIAGLLKFEYTTVASVRFLLERTENARAWVSFDCLPEFATCAVSHALALCHPEYANELFWKGTTATRLREANLLFQL